MIQRDLRVTKSQAHRNGFCKRRAGAAAAITAALAVTLACGGCMRGESTQWAQTSPTIKPQPATVSLGVKK